MRAPPTRTVSSRESLDIVQAIDAIVQAINQRETLKIKRAAVVSMMIHQTLPGLCRKFNVPLPVSMLPPKQNK